MSTMMCPSAISASTWATDKGRATGFSMVKRQLALVGGHDIGDVGRLDRLFFLHVLGERVAICEFQGVVVTPFVSYRSGNLATCDASSGGPGQVAGINLNVVGQI